MLFYHPSSLASANSFPDSSSSAAAVASSTSATTSSSASSGSLISRPRLVLDTHQLDNIASSISQSHLVNLDSNHYPVDHLRPGKSSAYRNSPSSNYNYDYRPNFSSSVSATSNSASQMYSFPHSSSSNSSWTENHYPHSADTATPCDESPDSSPQAAQARPPVSFPQPLSAPHDQPTFSHQYPSRYSSDRTHYLDAPSAPPLDRRMSEPALLSGNHPAAYRVPSSIEPPSRYSNSYTTSSTYSPPDLQYQHTSRTSYTEHSRNDSTGSSVGPSYASESRSHWTGNVKQEDVCSDANAVTSLNYSPRPSTASGSTGMGGTSPIPTYSLSAASPTSAISISPDLPTVSTQQLSEHPVQGDHQASSPSNSNKTYAFVSLPGTTIRKRPRRRYDEIERLYHCSWPDCAKAYGTLNHLNAHVVMQKHGPRRLPAEFKELRKQWRKAKKEGTFTPPTVNSTHPRLSTPSSPAGQYPPQNSYYPSSGPSSANERRRRMTDPNPPPMSSYRSPNAYNHNAHASSNLGGSGWVEDSDRRYSVSMAYPSSDSAVAEDVYGSYSDTPLPQSEEEPIGGYRQVSSSTNMIQQGYSLHAHSNNQDHYGQGYSYPLPSPPSSSQQQDARSNGSPPSPSPHHRYSTGTSLPPISSSMSLNRVPADGAVLASLHDYRATNAAVTSGDGEDSRDGATPGSRSTGSEYDEPRGSYALHSQTQQQHHTYGYDDYENDGDSATGPYSLGRNRLPRDSTLLTPLNLEHLRYGNGKGV